MPKEKVGVADPKAGKAGAAEDDEPKEKVGAAEVEGAVCAAFSPKPKVTVFGGLDPLVDADPNPLEAPKEKPVLAGVVALPKLNAGAATAVVAGVVEEEVEVTGVADCPKLKVGVADAAGFADDAEPNEKLPNGLGFAFASSVTAAEPAAGVGADVPKLKAGFGGTATAGLSFTAVGADEEEIAGGGPKLKADFSVDLGTAA